MPRKIVQRNEEMTEIELKELVCGSVEQPRNEPTGKRDGCPHAGGDATQQLPTETKR